MDTTSKSSAPKKGLAGLFARIHLDSQTLLLLAVFLVLMLFFAIGEDRFLTVRSVSSMGFQLAEIGVLALAMMITILTGGINLSVNATSNMAAVLAGIFMVRGIPESVAPEGMGIYVIIAMGIALLVGLIAGIINGILIAFIGVPPILATLATMTLFTGISTGITGGKTVTGFPQQLGMIGAETFLGIPIPFIIFVVLTIITHILLFNTTFGFKVRMLGSNPVASNFSGIDNKAILMKVYVISGLLSAVTGILIMSRTMSAAYEYGTTTYVLLTILISVLAGILPGFGNVVDIFIAVLILQILSTGFHMLLTGTRGSSFFKDFAWGVLMIAIFVVNYFARHKKLRE